MIIGKKFFIERKHMIVCFLIVIALFIALSPVILSNNYLRQDDLKTGIWWGMLISDEKYIYYNTVYQLVRPICMLLFFITDLLSINMHYAVYARLFSVILVGALGITIYYWQLLFNQNRVLAASYAIAGFTLPGIQLFAATANYMLIIAGLLLTAISTWYWYAGFKTTDGRKKRNHYYSLGNFIFFLGLLDYPLSSMYAWLMLAICYVNTRTASEISVTSNKRFFFIACKKIIFLMLSYFVFIKVFQIVFNVNLNYGRTTAIDTSHLLQRFYDFITLIVLHARQWFYIPESPWVYYHSMLFTCASCFLAFIYIQQQNKNPLKRSFIKSVGNMLIVFILLLLAYSPAMTQSGIGFTFRYSLVTMPLLLYLAFWSVNVNISALSNYFPRLQNYIFQPASVILFISTAIFGVMMANLMIADGIVGPLANDFEYIENQLNQKAIPLLKMHQQIVIHMVDCDHGTNYHFEPKVPDTLEYGMRLCMYPNHLIGALNHSLMTLGYISNKHRQNTVETIEGEIVVTDVPWGYMIFNSTTQLKYPTGTTPVVTIDMRDITPYHHLDFYRKLLNSL